MRIQLVITTAAVGLFAFLAVSCSKTPPEEAALRQRFSIPDDMPVRDLGEVQLTAGTPRRVSLGKGRDCSISAVSLTGDLLRMTLVYESSDELVDGVTASHYTERSTFLLHRGERCAPKMGKQLMVVMRPVLMTP